MLPYAVLATLNPVRGDQIPQGQEDMHLTDAPQHHDTEPPIETGTSWGYKLLVLLYVIPISAAIGAFPIGWLLVFCYLDKKGLADIDISAAIICFLVAVNLLTATVGIVLFRSGLGVFLQRVRVDEEGLHVWELKWQHFPWSKISSHNFVTFHSKNGGDHGFMPHAPGVDPATPIRGKTRFLRALLSRASFSFNALPRKAREDILCRIHARLPEPTPPVLPDVIRFRIGECPFRKWIVVDRGGVSIGSWGRERRYAWDNVKEMVIRRSSPIHPSFDRLYIRFTDEEELAIMQVSRFGRAEEQPGKEVIAGFFLRYVPEDRVIDLTPGASISVKALEYQLQSVRKEINSSARIAVWSFVAGVTLLGIGMLWLFLSVGNIPKETLTRITLWYMLATISFVGLYGIPCLHRILFRLPAVQKRLDAARARTDTERGRRASQ